MGTDALEQDTSRKASNRPDPTPYIKRTTVSSTVEQISVPQKKRGGGEGKGRRGNGRRGFGTMVEASPSSFLSLPLPLRSLPSDHTAVSQVATQMWFGAVILEIFGKELLELEHTIDLHSPCPHL